MGFAVPHEEDGPEAWRAVAVRHAHDEAARDALLSAADAGPDSVAHAVWPALLARTRGRAHAQLVERIAARAASRRAGVGVLWALCAVALGPQDALRRTALSALRAPAFQSDHAALSWALSLSARVVAARGAGPRERSALAGWIALGGRDALDGLDPAEAWRRWISGRERPEGIEYALMLAAAGARRAELEHLRAVAEHVITLSGTASPQTGALWRWLATGGADGAADEGAGRSSWRSAGPRVVALSALSLVRASDALAHLAFHAGGHGGFDRAVLEHVLRVCARDALRDRADEASLPWTVLASRVEERSRSRAALDAAVERVCDGLERSEHPARDLLRVLLGHEEPEATGGAREGAIVAPWLSPALRVRVLCAALANDALDARGLALRDLESRGAPAAVRLLLRDVARSDPDPITRQRARQLAREGGQGPE
jgi:hypothetical protein